jgi:hypothetical protein
MHAFLMAHLFWVGVGALWFFSAFVGGMPAPDAASGKGYRWLYGSVHLFAANLDKVNQSVRLPLQ